MNSPVLRGVLFFAVVVVQWADVLIAKTRINSLVVQGLEYVFDFCPVHEPGNVCNYSNHVLNTSLLFTCFLSTLLLFTPYVQHVLHVDGIRYSSRC